MDAEKGAGIVLHTIKDALKMDVQTQNETKDKMGYQQRFCSSITEGFAISQADSNVSRLMPKPGVMQLDGNERLKLAVNDLQIGRRIQNELKRQGRTVTWLASQLGMERASLYYIFRQNSIDMELMLRISFFLQHDFLHDVGSLFRSYGL